MRFINNTNIELISNAAKKADALLDPFSGLVNDLRLKNDWKYDSGAGIRVALAMSSPAIKLNIFTYRPMNPFTSSVAHCDWNGIHFNIYKVNKLSEAFAVGILLHEAAHDRGFHHIDPGWWGKRRANYQTEEKNLYSVPYYLSENVSKWL